MIIYIIDERGKILKVVVHSKIYPAMHFTFKAIDTYRKNKKEREGKLIHLRSDVIKK